MNAEQFSELRYAAVHELKRLNESCDQQFHINFWPRWDYDLERGTLTFSQEEVPKVIASIQVVGTTVSISEVGKLRDPKASTLGRCQSSSKIAEALLAVGGSPCVTPRSPSWLP
jgi:uncharacterized protein DUF6882